MLCSKKMMKEKSLKNILSDLINDLRIVISIRNCPCHFYIFMIQRIVYIAFLAMFFHNREQ